MKQLLIFTLVSICFQSFAQNRTDYYYEIPEYPEKYSAGTVASRLLDGLGYRYYWATASLTEEDYNYRPGKEARSSGETIDHVWNLTVIIKNAALKEKTDFSKISAPEGYAAKREAALENIKQASLILRESSDKELEAYDLVFKRDEGESSYPFWNGINGPIADAIWHAGQLASFRRSSGNPINSKASMMTGKVKE